MHATHAHDAAAAPLIAFDDFLAVDIRVGTVIAAEHWRAMQAGSGFQPLDGGDLLALGLGCERQTGERRHAVNKDGAGAALTLVATFFAAGEKEMFSQRVQQTGARIERFESCAPFTVSETGIFAWSCIGAPGSVARTRNSINKL